MQMLSNVVGLQTLKNKIKSESEFKTTYISDSNIIIVYNSILIFDVYFKLRIEQGR